MSSRATSTAAWSATIPRAARPSASASSSFPRTAIPPSTCTTASTPCAATGWKRSGPSPRGAARTRRPRATREERSLSRSDGGHGMRVAVGIAGVVVIVVIMWDTFEALVLPRRVTRRLRPTRLFYRTTWHVWSGLGLRMPPGGRRETYLSFYGPLSLLVLLWLWAAGLIVGFAMLQWGLGSHLSVAGRPARFADDLYMSGTTFVTLGLGDVAPTSAIA